MAFSLCQPHNRAESKPGLPQPGVWLRATCCYVCAGDDWQHKHSGFVRGQTESLNGLFLKSETVGLRCTCDRMSAALK